MEHNINKLKEITNQSTWKFIGLSMVTAGIYPLMWAWKNVDLFNEELGSKSVHYKMILAIAILNGIGSIFFLPIQKGLRRYSLYALHF